MSNNSIVLAAVAINSYYPSNRITMLLENGSSNDMEYYFTLDNNTTGKYNVEDKVVSTDFVPEIENEQDLSEFTEWEQKQYNINDQPSIPVVNFIFKGDEKL